MPLHRRIFRTGAMLLAGVAIVSQIASASLAGERIVAIGGSVTEIIFRLGEGGRLVARDTTSTWPPEAEALPDIGYIRALSPEGVLSVEPDLILSLEGAGPPEAVALLREAGVGFIEIPDGNTAQSILDKILAVGAALEVEDKAEALAREVGQGLASVGRLARQVGDRTRTMFILAVQDGRILASGRDTQADGILALAGAENVLGDFAGYKPVSDEAIVAAAPEAILVMSRGPQFGTQREQLLSHPAIAATPAGRSGRIVAMDGMYLLGFGPRTAEAAQDLHRALYGRDGGE